MKKKNLAIRGGAFPGKNAYVPFEFELEIKAPLGYKIGIAAGSSVGGLQVGMTGCGLYGDPGKEALQAVRYDEIMRMTGKLESSNFPFLLKIPLAPIAFVKCKRQLSPEFHAVLREKLSWALFRHVGLIERGYIGIADQNSWGFITGSDRVSGFRDMYKLLEAGGRERYPEFAEKIPCYWGSHDGWYKWTLKKGFHKISDTVSPLGDLVYGTFNNPILKRIYFEIRIGGKKTRRIKAFDPGAVCNFSNLVFLDGAPFEQIACTPEPVEGDPSCFSDTLYNLHPAKKGHYHYLPPTDPTLKFFDFTNKKIASAYDRRRSPSNVLG